MNELSLTDTERVREALADHFVMWRPLYDTDGPRGEWFCECGLKFGFSDSAIDHQTAAVERIVAARVAEAKVEAWDGGYGVGYDDCIFDQRGLSTDSDAHEYPHANPYRGLLAADDTEGKP